METRDLDELDRLSAIHVMGWQGIYLEGSAWVLPSSPPGCIFKEREDWNPTRNIAQAWELLEKIGVGVTVDSNSASWRCWFCGGYEGIAQTAPIAITKACLKAKGVEIED